MLNSHYRDILLRLSERMGCMRASEFYPDNENPLVKAFLSKFDEYFMASIHDAVEYVDKDENSYDIPETESEFFDLLSVSIKTGKNELLKRPKYVNLPDDALI